MWLIWIITALWFAGCRSDQVESKLSVQPFEPPLTVPDFTLTTTQGDPYQLSQTKADLLLIYFGYTNCPDLCLLTLWDIREALAELTAGQDRIEVLFISVDPERDTPTVLAQYLANFNPHFIGLRDEPTQVEQVLDRFNAAADIEPMTSSQGDYLISHSAYLYLVDPKAGLVAAYPPNFKAEDIRSDLAYLLTTKPE
jgi:protein SCO1/2